MKIGILGTRGIPNAYGGFEQFAQYLARGLFQKGHEVFVYNSDKHPYQEKTWHGIQLIHCKDPEESIGSAGQFIYDYNCLRDARRRRFDILLQLGYTSNSIWHRWWPRGETVNVVNMDGLEWMRSKYGPLTQRFLQTAEKWAANKGDVLIADSIGIRDYLSEKYGKKSIYIPYGAEIPEGYDPSVLSTWGLEPGKYFLLVARMEPENNIEMIIRGYLASSMPYPLVLVGNPGNKFGSRLAETYRNDNVRFIGAVYDQDRINNLRHYSALYFHGHSVGGTNPSLLEAMACGCNIAAHGNVFNKAILTDCADYFSAYGDIAAIIDRTAGKTVTDDRRERNMEKIKTLFNWETVIDQYEDVFLGQATNLQR
ncbi:MAG: DUF1972 domain-containing protein [Bacteroidetes bacterium]|nr:DUF1972 domain-containing protein [Bacteroidota bacterium]